MNKDIYLQDLYKSLLKYDTINREKHVSEYEYIISEMQEGGETFDSIIEKLGTPVMLAASIAEEFDYQVIDQNQYQEPIYKRNYKQQASPIIAKIINGLFIFGSIIYFIAIAASFILAMFFIIFFPIIGPITKFFSVITLLSSLIIAIGVYLLALNFKRLLINLLRSANQEKPAKFKAALITTIASGILTFLLLIITVVSGGSRLVSELYMYPQSHAFVTNYIPDPNDLTDIRTYIR